MNKLHGKLEKNVELNEIKYFGIIMKITLRFVGCC